MNNNPGNINYIYSVTPSLPSIALNSSDANYFIGETSANFCAVISNPNRSRMESYGCYLYDRNGVLLKKYTDTADLNNNPITIWANTQTEMGVTLSTGTVYQYEMFAVFNGVEYKTPICGFKTNGPSSLTGLAWRTYPNKTQYYVGETLNTAGLTLNAYYSDGSSQVVSDGYTVSGLDFSRSGRQELVVSYGGYKATYFPITIVEKTLSSISLKSPPKKTVYYTGDALNLTGAAVMAAYSDGSKKEIPVSSAMVSGYNANRAGKQALTVTYGGKTASFTVTVQAKAVSSIALKKDPSKTAYWTGETLDLSGAEITVKYNNGVQEHIAVSSSMVSGYNANRAGSQTLTVTYAGKTTTLAVTVLSRVPAAITSSTYAAGGGQLSRLGAGTMVSALLNRLNEKAYCKVYKGNTEVSGNTLAGTGMEVRLMDGSTVKAKVTIVVTGDINGDGAVSITDMLAVKAHLLKKSTLSGVAGKAADTSGDKAVSITDFLQMKAQILGKDKIQPRAC